MPPGLGEGSSDVNSWVLAEQFVLMCDLSISKSVRVLILNDLEGHVHESTTTKFKKQGEFVNKNKVFIGLSVHLSYNVEISGIAPQETVSFSIP